MTSALHDDGVASRDHAMGIDLGGTHVKVICVTLRGEVVHREERETGDDGSRKWQERVREAFQSAVASQPRPPRWVGLSAPGLASRDGRAIDYMPGRLSGLEGLDWTEFLLDGATSGDGPQACERVHVLNDAHAALLGEAWCGAAQGLRDVAMLTLGTGVGGAVLAAGEILRGHIGRAGHLGHMCLGPDLALDCVNTPGSLDDLIGNETIVERSGGRFASTRELVEAHRAGDEQASALWLRSVYLLACGVTSIINAFDPEAIILGGGIVSAGDALFGPLDEHLDRIEWRPGGHRVRILAARLGERAGAVGAAYNAIRSTSPELARDVQSSS